MRLMEGFSEPLEFGPYRVFAKVAQGGMAEVLLATSSQPEYQGQGIGVLRVNGPGINEPKPHPAAGALVSEEQADRTCADAAASTNRTGAASLGGDWDL